MSYLEWTDELDVGVDAMNGEHKKLIGLMNDFAEISKSGSREEALKALEALGEYTVTHFRNEEAMMERIGFPEIANHRRIHQRLLTQLSEHVERFKATGVSQDVLMFLKVWLKAHIKGIDTKYGAHAKHSAA